MVVDRPPAVSHFLHQWIIIDMAQWERQNAEDDTKMDEMG